MRVNKFCIQKPTNTLSPVGSISHGEFATQFLPASDAAGQKVPIAHTEHAHLLGEPIMVECVPSGHDVQLGAVPVPSSE